MADENRLNVPAWSGNAGGRCSMAAQSSPYESPLLLPAGDAAVSYDGGDVGACGCVAAVVPRGDAASLPARLRARWSQRDSRYSNAATQTRRAAETKARLPRCGCFCCFAARAGPWRPGAPRCAAMVPSAAAPVAARAFPRARRLPPRPAAAAAAAARYRARHRAHASAARVPLPRMRSTSKTWHLRRRYRGCLAAKCSAPARRCLPPRGCGRQARRW